MICTNMIKLNKQIGGESMSQTDVEKVIYHYELRIAQLREDLLVVKNSVTKDAIKMEIKKIEKAIQNR